MPEVEASARDQLLKLARDLPYMANAKSKPVSVVLAEAKAKLQAIEDSLGGERQPFQRITAAELATGKFDLTYLIDGVLVKAGWPRLPPGASETAVPLLC